MHLRIRAAGFLPLVGRDTYLNGEGRMQIKLLDRFQVGDGSGVEQRPGPNNALGLVKFVFPNDHNVCLHDTPTQQLFGRARRDFSHGCVRVADPVGLAQWVLEGEGDWTRERVQAAMNGAASQRVTLSRPIQVILFYLTAVVMPEDGTIHFADDIYGHDRRLDAALRARGSSARTASTATEGP